LRLEGVQHPVPELSCSVPAEPDGAIPLFVEGEVRWTGAEVKAGLARAGLPEQSQISVLAVELLPEPNGNFADPLAGDLGEVRILRTSPLCPVARNCCTP
jgi:hypothetical protein